MRTRGSIKRLIKSFFFFNFYQVDRHGRQVGSPFEGDLLSRGVASRRRRLPALHQAAWLPPLARSAAGAAYTTKTKHNGNFYFDIVVTRGAF